MRYVNFAAAILMTGLAGAELSFAAVSESVLKIMSQDAPASADSVLTGRYEGSFILGQTVRAFDEITLPAGPSEGKSSDSRKFSATVTAQGRVSRTLYIAPEGRSSLEVLANFQDALTDKGFAPVFSCAKENCGESFPVLKYRWDAPDTHVISESSDQRRTSVVRAMFDRLTDPRYVLMKSGEGDEAAYAAVYAAQNKGGTFGDISDTLNARVGVLVEIVEPKAREKKMVTISAEEIGSTIAADGKIILYGILFDFDKATIKPESQPQLDEMARFLSANPDITVYVVGHTDSKGKLDYNMKLSTSRAEAVVKALAGAGVPAKRMLGKGVGPLVPVASNRSEEGQALNRRVELVEQ